MSETMNTESTTSAYFRSIVYAGLANAFRHPDAELLALMGDDRRFGEWSTALAGTIGDEVADPFAKYRARVGRQCAGEVWSLSSLEVAHNSLFGHAVRGRVPAYECEYGRSEINQRASQLADLAGFYEAFGMSVVDVEAGRPDFIAVECEFMSVLCAKEAHGCEFQERELFEQSRHAQRQFLKDHLVQWLPALARRLIDAGEHDFYVALGQLADALCTVEARRSKITTGPRWLELRPVDAESETTISCFDANDCGPQAGEQLVPLNVNLAQD